MSAIRFLHRGEVRTIERPDPTLTVLRWLREDERLTGTKEGCAEGDCGACTVVVGSLTASGQVAYRAVNACILFLPMLDGKQLITLEDLGTSRDPHPIQLALANGHGSQCGFCTPGFVMSLFAQSLDPETGPGATTLADALAGNLCRCTGYRPILDAGRAVLAAAPEDRFAAARQQAAATLASLRSDATTEITFGTRRYFAPRRLEDLADLVAAHPQAHLLAGGTDLGLEVTKAHRELATVIHLGDVPELARVEETDDTLVIGAGVTYRDAMAPLMGNYPETAELFRRLGAVQVRNLGTIGGNVANASPIGDTPPLLLALDAAVILNRGGETRRVPIDAFFVDYRKTALRPGEFLQAIEIPRRHPDDVVAAYKISKRFDQDISAVCGVFRLRLDGTRIVEARLAYGGMAATTKRAAAAEAALSGREWTAAAADVAAEAMTRDFTPLTDFRASAAYRMLAAQNLLRKFQLETSAGDDDAQERKLRVLAYA